MLDENLAEGVDTVAEAQEELGLKSPSIRNWTWDLLETWRRVVGQNRQRAAEAVDFIQGYLARFSGEEDDFRRAIEAEFAHFLGEAGRVADAEDICRGHISEHPEEARAYCTLSDVYLAADPPKLERALEVLQEAADHPVEDGRDYDLSRRIDHVQRQLELKEARASDHFIEWDEFWDRFEEAELDKQIEMARDRIDNAPDFDAEWAFALMIDWLLTPCARQGRGEDWLAVLDELCEKRPEQVESESGVLGAHAVEFALAEDPDYLDTALDLLFADPAGSIDHIFREFDALAFVGKTRLLDHLIDAWPSIRTSGNLMADTVGEWADWAMMVQVAVWAEEDVERPRSLEEVDDGVDEMLEVLDSERVELHFTSFLGPEPVSFDAEAVASLDGADPAVALCFAFARHLFDDHDWPALKALLAAAYLRSFAPHLSGCEDPFRHKLVTHRAKRSRGLRRELKRLRELWRADYEFAPHPDLAVGFAELIAHRGMFADSYAAVAFFEGAVRMAPWLAERGFIENPKLVEVTQRHFARRIDEVRDDIVSLGAHRTLLEESLAETEEWLRQ
ncbi:MAG: hypothetical protein ACOCV2_07535 [Persicimonas sp.]